MLNSKHMHTLRVGLLTLAFFLPFMAGAGIVSAHDKIEIEGAFARASATPAAKAGAAYMTIINHGHADRLIGASAPVSKRTMIHETVTTDGIAKMEHRSEVNVPMHGSVTMKPGGLHIMLMGLKAPLKEGDTFPLTLDFEDTGSIEVIVHVGGIAADGVDHGDHSGHGTHGNHGTTE